MEMMNRLDKQGDALLLEGDYAAAWNCYHRALILRQKVNTSDNGLPAARLQKMYAFLEAIVADRPEEALPYLEEALVIWEQMGLALPQTGQLSQRLREVLGN